MHQLSSRGLPVENKDLINYDYNPTHLIADAAGAFANGFTNTFVKNGNKLTRVMCWFHADKAMKDRLKSISDDIGNLQLCVSEQIFDKAFELFKIKWETETDFIDYFESE